MFSSRKGAPAILKSAVNPCESFSTPLRRTGSDGDAAHQQYGEK